MAILIGIKDGDSNRYKAGATRKEISLSVATDATGTTATICGQRVKAGASTLIFWHKGDAGSYHGIHCPEKAKYKRCGEDTAIKEQILEYTSSSGGGSGAAVVCKIPQQGIAIYTSGYDGRRGHKLTIIKPDGSREEINPAEYRRQHEPVQDFS